jgi:uncharacterized RDD family membrane protein YckC
MNAASEARVIWLLYIILLPAVTIAMIAVGVVIVSEALEGRFSLWPFLILFFSVAAIWRIAGNLRNAKRTMRSPSEVK